MAYKEFIMTYSLGVFDENTLIMIAETSKSKRVLAILSKDKNPDVRYCVAGNLNTSVEVLKELWKDKNPRVRRVAGWFI